MKKIIATTISLCALTAFNAGAHEFKKDQCNINLNGDLRFVEQTLTVKTSNEEKVKITSDYRVYLNDEQLTLSAQETQWIQSYYDGIVESIPQVMTVAAEGMKIANYAVSEVLRGFLGSDSKVAAQLETKMNGLYSDLKDHVYQNPDYLTLDTAVLESELGLGPDFDQEVDQIVSEVMEGAMGEFFVQLGKSMLNGEGTMSSFEQRMAKMGDDIETKIEGQTKDIEREAEKLCEMLTTIDASEDNVQKIKGLNNLNMVTLHKNA